MSHFEWRLNRLFWRSKKLYKLSKWEWGGGCNLDKIQKNSSFFSCETVPQPMNHGRLRWAISAITFDGDIYLCLKQIQKQWKWSESFRTKVTCQCPAGYAGRRCGECARGYQVDVFFILLSPSWSSSSSPFTITILISITVVQKLSNADNHSNTPGQPCHSRGFLLSSRSSSTKTATSIIFLISTISTIFIVSIIRNNHSSSLSIICWEVPLLSQPWLSVMIHIYFNFTTITFDYLDNLRQL